MERENVKNIQNLLVFGGRGNLKLRGENLPPKGPENNTASKS